MSKILIEPGVFYTVDSKGKRHSIKDVDALLKEIAKCCGVDCCRNGLVVDDTGTGTKSIIYVENGTVIGEPLTTYDADH